MGSETTPEMLGMARRIVAKWYRMDAHRALESVAISIEKGERDQFPQVQAALAAIKETTELAAKLADQRAKFWRDAAAMNLPVCPSPVIGNDRAEKIASVATALRNGEHYHDR